MKFDDFLPLLFISIMMIGCDQLSSNEQPIAGDSFTSLVGTFFTDQAAVDDIMIGALGCSMTRDLFDPGLKNNTTLDGWLKLTPAGGKVLKSYSGGTITRWGIPGANGYSIKWGAFDQGVSTWGADVVLWQICTRSDEVRSNVAEYTTELEHIAGRIAEAISEEELPNVIVVVTGLPRYAPGHVCSITGADGVQFSRDLAEYAGTIPGVMYAAGLDLELEDAGDLSRDGCHASAQGSKQEAEDFREWLIASGF